MMAPASFKWAPLKDLPSDFGDLARSELRSLSAVWLEQRELLSQGSALKEFLEKLQRQWAIETGIIERVYSLDRGITQVLIEKGIDASFIPREATDQDPELVAQIIRDHKEAVEGLFDFIKGNRSLSTGYIKELHAVLTRHQEKVLAVNTLGRQFQATLLRGEYKKLPNNPSRPDGTIHEYCPPEHVAAEMEELLQLHHAHEQSGVPPEVETAWFHHRFSQIHPFQDGNGRVARTLASLIFIKADWFPLAVYRDDRERYIAALEESDRGNLSDLVNLFTGIQRRTFVQVLGIAAEAQQRRKIEQVIAAARQIFQKRQEVLRREWERAKETASILQNLAKQRLEDVASKVKTDIGPYLPKSAFFVDDEPQGGARSYYFRNQIITTAKSLDYFANTSIYRAWVRLVLRIDTVAEILLSFHGIGPEYRGILGSSMCFFRREETESGEREVASLLTVSDEVFQINYREEVDQAKKRFLLWIDNCLVKALEMWRVGL
jgi:Fic family protein